MASIADVFLRALLEDKQLQIDAQKSGDKAGQTMGGRMSKGIGTAMRAGLGVMAAGAAIATRGLLELENVTADFTAETGATADEAKRAGQAINEMAGRNLQPMKEIGATLAKVHTDLGLTGDAAEDTAERFLKFALVTKRDAAEEVAAFDDILDAWGLTAGDATGLMDKLIASHQKYGGSITENEDALAKMAPQLRALNLDIDDGIGLLNLFATSGLDASAGQKALNAAITNLPPGESMDEFIVRLSSIEDDGERAKLAMEVFGKRAGAGLANAIRPGIDSLDDFQVSTAETTDALDDAVEAIEGTFGNRTTLLLKGFTSQLIALGSGFGPVLTGLASLTTLAGALGFGTLTKKLSAGLAGAWKAAFASSLVTGVIAKGGSLAATLYLRALMVGDAVAGALRAGWAKVIGNSVIAGIIAKAGTAAATGYLKFLLAGSAISGALTGMWTAVAGTGSKATAAAGAAGRAAGLAYQGAFLLGLAALAAAPLIALKDNLVRAGEAGRALEAGVSLGDQAVMKLGQDAGWLQGPLRDLAVALGLVKNELLVLPSAAGAGLAALDPAKTMDDYAADIAAGLAAGRGEVEAAAGLVMSTIPEAVEKARRGATTIAATIPGALSSALRDDRTAWQRAWDTLKDDAANSMSTTVEIAKIKGKLAKIAASEGWKSGDPVWIQSLKDTQTILENRLGQLAPAAKKDGEDAGEGLADGLTRKQRRVRAAAAALAEEARNRFNALQNSAYRYGSNTGDAYVDGLLAELRSGKTSVKNAIYAISRLMYANTPPKYRESPLFGIDRWGGATGEAYTSPLVEQIQGAVARVRRSLADMSNALTQPMGMPAVAMAGIGALGGSGSVPLSGLAGTTISSSTGPITVNVDARGATNPHAVGQAVGDAMASVLRDQTARLPRSGR